MDDFFQDWDFQECDVEDVAEFFDDLRLNIKRGLVREIKIQTTGTEGIMWMKARFIIDDGESMMVTVGVQKQGLEV